MRSPRAFALAAAATLALPLLLFTPRTAHAQSYIPLQMDLSAGGLWGRYDKFPTASLYAGIALMDSRAQFSPFLGGGFEATVAPDYAPYQWTAGLGTRTGFAFRWRRRMRYRVPDLYVYARATAIVGAGQEAIEVPGGLTEYRERTGGGARLGIGLTAPGWTVALLEGARDSNTSFVVNQASFVCGFSYLVISLLNHAELTVEWYGPDVRETYARVGFRIGTGF